MASESLLPFEHAALTAALTDSNEKVAAAKQALADAKQERTRLKWKLFNTPETKATRVKDGFTVLMLFVSPALTWGDLGQLCNFANRRELQTIVRWAPPSRYAPPDASPEVIINLLWRPLDTATKAPCKMVHIYVPVPKIGPWVHVRYTVHAFYTVTRSFERMLHITQPIECREREMEELFSKVGGAASDPDLACLFKLIAHLDFSRVWPRYKFKETMSKYPASHAPSRPQERETTSVSATEHADKKRKAQ